MTDYSLVPVVAMAPSVQRYVEQGGPIDGFLSALFEHDMMGTICRADAANYRKLREWVQFMHCEMPTGSHGSRAATEAWRGTCVASVADEGIA